ncbi:MAG: hypothetical protein IJW31_00375 [Lentisphaeria bacterium]|nr:hypothetical protein [Lentisphaeria bacterium]
MKKFLQWFIIACMAGIIGGGCNSYDSDFVYKSEKALKAMEDMSAVAHEEFLRGSYNDAEARLRSLITERTVSRPLYQLELISVLLMNGKKEEAHELMMRLHEDLELLFDAESEEKAQSIWHGEINKVYKGDSYERATFYALMALSFIQQENYEDALRAIKNGLLADADSNSEDAINDYALLHYLGYFAAQKLNYEAEAQEYLQAMFGAMGNRNFNGHENNCFSQLQNNNANTLLVVWVGEAPTVACTGEYEENRTIICGRLPFTAMSLAVNASSAFMVANNLGDLDYQATTRGGRLMDNVLANKAAVKKGMEVTSNIFFIAGTGLIIAGGACINSSPTVGICLLGAGGSCYICGLGIYFIGYMMNPAADGRYWRNIPGQLYIIPLNLPQGEHKIALTGYHNSDRVALSIFDVNISDDTKMNIIHLPMMQQSADIWQATQDKLQEEITNAEQKAGVSRFDKELK